MDTLLHTLFEEVVNEDYVIGSYFLVLNRNENPYEKAKSMAVGQTVGTWLPVPGITEDMRKNHMGRIVNIIDVNPADLSSQVDDEKSSYIFQIAYPVSNFDDRLPLMLTTLLGNDASTSVQAKLLDLFIPPKLAARYPGPQFGLDGIRKLVNVEKRPMLLNMIKPCIGFEIEDGAKIFYNTALGGVDFIKDDELLGNPDFCPLKNRVRAYVDASEKAFEITGKRTLYIPNITDHVAKLIDNAKIAEENGAKAIMLNFASVGLSGLQMVREAVSIPIMGHYAGAGPYYEGAFSGISSDLMLGKLPRLCGADIVMINTPYGGYPIKKTRYLKTVAALTLPFYDKKPVVPSCGGGVNPGVVHRLMKDLGNDIILAPGGAIQGHPMGAAAGIHAMYDAIDAEMNGKSLEQAVSESKELQAGEYMWKGRTY